MMRKDTLKRIQALTFDAYLESGKVMALMEGGDMSPLKLSRSLDKLTGNFEKSVLELRALCEQDQPVTIPRFARPEAKALQVAGSVEVNEYGWLHITLNTLLPHCRFGAASWLTDTIARLLDDFEGRGRPLPRFDTAMLIIDEHCDIESRTVYDQDNKGYKAIPNALKGRLIKDDDQFSLGLSLISTPSDKPACHIYLLPIADTGDFFGLKFGGFAMFV